MVPYALQPKFEEELGRLQTVGVIEQVEYSEWAAPIVLVLKKDSLIQICRDYKFTVSRAAKKDTFLLPRIEDNFHLPQNGGQVFTRLNLAHAY